MGLGIIVALTFCDRLVTPDWALSLASLEMPINTNYSRACTKGVPIDEARNALAETAINNKAKYILFIDDDTAPPSFTIRRLMQILDTNPDAAVAGGIYFTKSVPPMPVVFKEDGEGPYWNWKFGDVFDCSGLGTGCMMVRTEAFRNIPKPWFKTVDDQEEIEAGPKYTKMNDDLYFCKKVREAGYRIIADGGVIPLHWQVESPSPHDLAQRMHFSLPADSYPAIPREKDPAKELTGVIAGAQAPLPYSI